MLRCQIIVASQTQIACPPSAAGASLEAAAAGSKIPPAATAVRPKNRRRVTCRCHITLPLAFVLPAVQTNSFRRTRRPSAPRIPAGCRLTSDAATVPRGRCRDVNDRAAPPASHRYFSGARAGLGFLSSFALGVASAARSPSTHCIPSRWCRKILGSWNTATLLPREQWNTRPLPYS